MRRAAHLRPAVLFLIAALSSAVWAGYSPATEADRVAIETVDSRDARVARVLTRHDDRGFTVSGYLRKSPRRRGPIPGYLSIEILGEDRAVLAQADSRYHRRNAKATRAYFSQTLQVDPGQVRGIRVVHHGLVTAAPSP